MAGDRGSGDWDEEAEPEPRRSGDRVAGILSSRTAIGGAIVAVAALVLIAISLLLIAGENHYRGCVYAVQVRIGTTDAPLARLGRQSEVANCSRSPF